MWAATFPRPPVPRTTRNRTPEGTAEGFVDEQRLKALLESLLFAAGEPVTLARLGAVLDGVPKEEIKNALAALGAEYALGGRGLALEEVAGGYQLRTQKEFAPEVRKLLSAKPPRLSRPLLETLAIIAYRQPITRPEIEQLRGVDSGGVLETLLERRFVRIAGRKETPGRPMLYATTPEFLETFGLKDLESLPDLKEFREIERATSEAESEAAETITDTRDTAREEAETPPSPDASQSESVARTDAGDVQSTPCAEEPSGEHVPGERENS
jgi:segregation and condensation protein B